MNHDPQFSPASVRTALAFSVCLAISAFAGCSQVNPLSAAKTPKIDIGNAPVLGAEPVAGGIYVPLGTYTPLSGQALARAKSDRPTILATINASVAPSTSTAPTTQLASPTEPPPLAVKYYLQGREKFLDGANTEAMEFLEKSLQLDPNAFTVLRLMGRVCFAASQLARGSLYLQKAQQAHPQDVEVNYLLGRYWLERKDSGRAIYFLTLAESSAERTMSSAQTPLTSFYLARSLQASGYHAAAAKEYEEFLRITALPIPGYRYDRELNYLIEEDWATQLAIAENRVLIGDYAAAVKSYQLADQGHPDDPFIESRLINAEMHANLTKDARAKALAWAVAAKGNDDALKLLSWVYHADGHDASLIPDLQSQLAPHANDSDSIATLASALDYVNRKQDAFNTLRDYLRKNPANTDILAQLLKRITSPEMFSAALRAAANALAADPAKQDDILTLFLESVQSPGAAPVSAHGLTPAASPEKDPGSPLQPYLLALTRQELHADPPLIDSTFHDALAQNENFLPAREAYVTWLLSQEKFPQASALIQQALDKNQGGPKTWQLLIQSESAQQRLTHALALARQAVEKFPTDPDIHMELASVYRLRGQWNESDTELRHVVDQFPRFEPGYKALVNSLVRHAQQNAGLNGQGGNSALTEVIALLTKMNRELPDSPFAQLSSATIYARSGQLEQSETLLRALVAKDASNTEALVALAEVRQVLGHPAEAAGMLEDALKSHPQLPVASALVDLYRAQEKPADAAALTARLAKENPDNEGFALLQISLSINAEKLDDAITLLTAAAAKFPHSEEVALTLANAQKADHKTTDAIQTIRAFINNNGETPDRLYKLSSFYAAADDDANSVATLQRVLTLMPDNTGANNDLGYFWADAGTHMAEAETMIKKAIDNEPNNSAFLDSMGWLLYKQGRFADAVTWFEKAIAQPEGMEADVLQHLADSLYRADRKPEAIERWTQAQALVGLMQLPLQKSEQKLKDYLEKTLTSARTGGTPQITPTAAEQNPAPK